ncbi:GntR family transcriptional regulator [Pigmentiphaga sp. H8]|uniref:GntR family transcriptional regulator n=1 Tax=unclassified Pigmentiphaga TaxID=2626614 RepID=UPI000F59D64D|nr:GntR family transcriptional regulator [Pigmentiphaga sp. H8]AZG07730.1 GntR family transcriptional regulator [Pigmentiphaga sp. H8]
MDSLPLLASGDSRLPLPEIIYKQLRVNILDGTLKPGAVLRQEEIAKLFNVSRVPVREAMGRLETDGLIVLRPRRGYAVTELQQDEIVEIFELRMVIEEHAATIAARARTQDDIDAVEHLLLQMEALAARSANYDNQWASLNRDFHSRLVHASRRKRLANIADTLRDTVEAYVRMEMRLTGDVSQALREHREIFEAFKAGDAHGLAMLSRSHVEETARRLLSGLRQKR